MIAHEVRAKPLGSQDRTLPSTIGGRPIVAFGLAVPTCRLCSTRMVLFFQLEVRAEFETPFRPGSLLSAFMCPKHNDIHSVCPDTRRDYSVKRRGQSTALPSRYWNRNAGHFKLLLLPPDGERSFETADEHLAAQRLSFHKRTEDVTDYGLGRIVGSQGFKVGGLPAWSQDPEYYSCSCGSAMRFLCQVPDGFGFQKLPAAPEQPNSFSAFEYCLFLGNDVYLFACVNQCRPEAVWPVLQN